MFRPCTVVVSVSLLILLIGVSNVKAETSSTEFWPESDNWLKLTKQWRLSMFFSLSKNIETKYREGNYIAQIDYVFGKTHSLHTIRLYDDNRALTLKPFMIRPGYLGGTSIGDEGQNYKERTGFVEFHLRNPLKNNVLVSHRVRADLRFLGDDNPDFSWRLRYRLQIEKEFTIKKTSLVPYINVEPYYDSRYEIVNRVRAIGGATAAWQKWYALEANFTYQYDSKSSINNIYAFNLILHLYFETKKAEQTG
jgi:hypothetical protein